MGSIYDRLMDIPLFKGVSRDFLNMMAEQTPLEFRSYTPGEMIISESQICDRVVCLISGAVSVSMKFNRGRLLVRQTLSRGAVLGIHHLFGMENKFNMNVEAAEDAGIMMISKKHYLRLLQSSQLLLINYVNLLSRMAQLGPDVLREHKFHNIGSELTYLIQLATLPESAAITLTSTRSTIAEFLDDDPDEGHRLLNVLENQHLIEIVDPYTVRVPSRFNLIESFRNT